jgi:hypothetical protein
MSTEVIPFLFDTHSVRTAVVDEVPWFVAADVCGVLGIKNHRDSLRHLDDDEKGVVSTDTLGGVQKISVVNESGLYALVLRSRKPEARRFAKWVTQEVLPSIRKTGQYIHGPQLIDPPYLAQARKEAMDHLWACYDVIRDGGQKIPRWEGNDETIVAGFIAAALQGSRFLAFFDDQMRLNLRALSQTACIIDPERTDSLEEAIKHHLPPESVAKIAQICLEKLSREAQKGLKKH